jgi:hypothetical protein
MNKRLGALPRVVDSCTRCDGSGIIGVGNIDSPEWEACFCQKGVIVREMTLEERTLVQWHLLRGGELHDLV